MLDLQAGALHPGDPRDYVRTVAPTEVAGLDEARAPLGQFLDEVFDDNADKAGVIPFLRRLFGYGLTGLSVERVVPILHGPGGRNGKDTLIEAVGHVLGPCAAPVSKAVFRPAARGDGCRRAAHRGPTGQADRLDERDAESDQWTRPR